MTLQSSTFPFCVVTYHFRLLMECISPSWFDTLGRVLRMKNFLGEENYLQTRGPGATSLTWVILANISINICKYCFPYCGPSRPRGTVVLTILNLHYIRKLSCKYDLFWLSGSGEEDFSMTPTHQGIGRGRTMRHMRILPKNGAMRWSCVAPCGASGKFQQNVPTHHFFTNT
jgi:hypothetical protein